MKTVKLTVEINLSEEMYFGFDFHEVAENVQTAIIHYAENIGITPDDFVGHVESINVIHEESKLKLSHKI
jgi:hypothetical protein